MQKNNICVIIPMYGFGEYTKKCIDLTFKNAGVPVDIVVVDDGTDIPFQDERVKVIRLEGNMGFTHAMNTGIKYAWNDYKYLHLLNNDTKPYPDFIKFLVKAFEDNPNAGIVSSVQEMDFEGKKAIFSYPIDCLSGYSAFSYEDLPEKYYNCPWIPLFSSLIRTDVIQQVGLLDRRMKNHCSDNDFCTRAGIMGYTTVLVPQSKVYHYHETTTRRLHLNAKTDQLFLIQKVRCDYQRSILENFPLDGEDKKMYELIFREKK